MPDRYLIVGEAPGRRQSPKWSSGRIRDLADRDLEEWAEWVNLIEEWPGPGSNGGSAWNARRAAARAKELTPSFPDYRGVILLGRRVAGALLPGGGGLPFFRWVERGGARIVVIPHPSGVVRWWNDAENIEKARTFLAPLATSIGEETR